MVSTPAAVKAFMLKLVELLYAYHDRTADLCDSLCWLSAAALSLRSPVRCCYARHLLDTGQYPRMHGALGKIARKLLRAELEAGETSTR